MKKAEYFVERLGPENIRKAGILSRFTVRKKLLKLNIYPKDFLGSRHYSTSIYFLLTSDEFSAFHRIKSDELWHFYSGTKVTIHIIDKSGEYSQIHLGNNPDNGEVFQCLIPYGAWFAASVVEPDSFALAGCIVSPGFDFDDIELGKRNELIKFFPKHKELIQKLTRE